jgi:hypothetical protein
MHVNIESLRKSMRKIVETDNDTGNRCTWVLNPGDSIDVVQACEGSKVCRRCGQAGGFLGWGCAQAGGVTLSKPVRKDLNSTFGTDEVDALDTSGYGTSPVDEG